MIHTDFIAAIQIGSTRLTGIVGKREQAGGQFTVMAYETESALGCIRRGCVKNANETAFRIRSLITKLQGRMPGSIIGKIFIGVGGQSVRSHEETIVRTLATNGKVTNELMDELKKESLLHRPAGWDVLYDDLEPACYLDERYESNPVGTFCTKIEARYQFILARPSIRGNISATLDNIKGLKGLAGIIANPIALSDAVLGEYEKDAGCALIDFGGGVTTLSVFKGGRLRGLVTIPFGGILITKDLSELLKISEEDAEKIKCEYGTAVAAENNTGIISVKVSGNTDLLAIKQDELYSYIIARQQEIFENVLAQIKDMTGRDKDTLHSYLKAGIFITGNASKLQHFAAALREYLQTDVHVITSIRKDLSLKGLYPDMTPDFVSIGLLLHGDRNYINCSAAQPAASSVIKPPAPPVVTNPPVIHEPEEEDEDDFVEEDSPLVEKSVQDAGGKKEQEKEAPKSADPHHHTGNKHSNKKKNKPNLLGKMGDLFTKMIPED
jgi:cell division protein FtsA